MISNIVSNKTKVQLTMVVIGSLIFFFGGYKVYMKSKAVYANILETIDQSNQMQSTYLLNTLKYRYNFDYSWVEDNRLIAHAMGGVKEIDYTNSLEAFEENYNKGYRVFEVDFDLTDEELAPICSHYRASLLDEKSKEIPYTLENFRNTKDDNGFTRLTGKDIIQLMADYPDIYIVTDMKFKDHVNTLAVLSQLARYAIDNDISILDRIIPQVYNEDMFWTIMNVYEWKSVIFSLYQTKWSEQSVIEFCNRTGVRFVTLWDYLATDEIVKAWSEENIYIAVHTVNDTVDAKAHLGRGIDLIYTDFLEPKEFVH